MNKFMFCGAAILCLSGVANAESHGLVATLNPLTEVAGTVNVPAKENCRNSGSRIAVRKCETPGASLTLTGSSSEREIALSKYTKITSYFEGDRYDEVYLDGAYDVNGGSIEVRVRLLYKEGIAYPGTINIFEVQSFPFVLDTRDSII